jgi:cytochrome c biogenesis factor
VAAPAALAQFACVTLAFAALVQAYVASDFSVVNVAQNSHSAKPLVYKISGTWANHEGSLVLWVWILALFGAAVAVLGRKPAGTLPGARAGRPGPDRRRVPGLHAADLEPVPAPRPGPARRPGP